VIRSLAPFLALLAFAGGAVASPWQLLGPVEAARTTQLSPGAVQATRVEVDADALAVDAERLDLALPDGRVVTVQHRRSEHRGAGHYSWFGHVAGDPEQAVHITRVGPHLSAVLQLKDAVYELMPQAEGAVLMRLDSDLFPDCAGATPAGDAPVATPIPVAPAAAAVGEGAAVEIDVLVVFSPGALSALGGTPQARTLAQSAVDVSNTAFANSDMVARFRLAGVRFTSRLDSGSSSTDLSWLRSDPQVAAWRNAHGADLVSMISEFSDACGRGYLMSNPTGAGFEGSAFQVTTRGCAVGNLSYPHEHGHNMGMQHNPEDGSGPAYPYAYGHYVNGAFRTVMSYSTPCPNGCTRRAYFSNPLINYSGMPTGIVDARDNARAGNLTAPVSASFRAPSSLLMHDSFE
jgi:hypothetical protein